MDHWEHCILTTTTTKDPAVVVTYPDHTVISRRVLVEGGRVDYDAAIRDASADLVRNGWEEIGHPPTGTAIRPGAVRMHFRRPTQR